MEDCDLIQEVLGAYQPETSEWTFTHLFLWRSYYGFLWSKYRDWKFRHSHAYSHVPLTDEHFEACLRLGELGCEERWCEEDLSLLGEQEAVREALNHFSSLRMHGGVILLGNQVQAFALGELLNKQTAVVYIEKANPGMPGLYALMNQQFAEKNWRHVPFINREQDLGEPGLRQARLTYHPDRLVEKFWVRLAVDS